MQKLKPLSVPFFGLTRPIYAVVISSLIPVLTAINLGCDQSKRDHGQPVNPAPLGMESKLGQKLIKTQSWCTPVKTEEDGSVHVGEYIFNAKGTFVFSEYILLANAAKKRVSESKGTWGVVNDQIFLSDESQRFQSQAESFQRPTDQEDCYTLTGSESGTENICSCSI